ncbi:argininosuccinate lyase [Alteribacter lacisalsi]|nr:argininosuccinate lyase [Alteribacter lacisalsi]
MKNEVYIRHILEPGFRFTRAHFLPCILKINLAHVQMLINCRIIDEKDGSKLITELKNIMQNQSTFADTYDPRFEDLFFMLENELENRLGPETAGNLHVAFSRNDMDAAMYRMFWRDRLLEWVEALLHLRKQITLQARQHITTIMPAYTHGQQAQPTTLAHYLLAVEAGLSRDCDRALALYDRINESPMGAVALSTTGFKIDRDFMCRELGFARIMGNSYDAVSAADYMVEIGGILTISLATLSRFVHDLMGMASNESGALRLDDRLVQISSVMPQKRNPSALEHTRAQISRSTAQLRGIPDFLRNVPLGDIVDIGDDIQPSLFDGFSHAVTSVELLAEVTAHADFNRKILYDRCKRSFSTSTEIADTLVREHSLTFRIAHKIVSFFVKNIYDQGKTPADPGLAKELEKAASKISGKDITINDEQYFRMTDPAAFINSRTIPGGPAPAEADRQLQKADLHMKQTAHSLDTLRGCH